jgi:hypothetical protein
MRDFLLAYFVASAFVGAFVIPLALLFMLSDLACRAYRLVRSRPPH